MQIEYIKTEQELHTAVDAIAQWPEFAIDTEFDRNRNRYGFNICMAQVATPEAIYLIDPLFISPDRAEIPRRMAPLWDLIRSSSHLKILHACSEDIRLFDKYGARPFQVFDTRIAAKVLCKPANSFSDLLLLELGVTLNKQHQTSNWFRRPISEEKRAYLAGDVAYLLELKTKLTSQLEEVGRIHWFEEEMAAQLDFEQVENYDADISPITRKREYHQLPPEGRFIVRELWAFRDAIAYNRDVPPYFVFPDEKLFVWALRTEPLIPGQAGKLSPHVNEHKLIQVFNNALHRARAGDFVVPKETRARPPRPGAGQISPDTAIALFKPVMQALTLKFGDEAASLLLSEASVKRIAFAGDLSPLPAYARQEVSSLAAQFPEIARFCAV